MPKQPFPAQVLAEELLVWWAEQGRHGIPWKLSPEGVSPAPEQDLDPYGIWIAEVMLQQTQFLSKFSNGDSHVVPAGCSGIAPVQHRWHGICVALDNTPAGLGQSEGAGGAPHLIRHHADHVFCLMQAEPREGEIAAYRSHHPAGAEDYSCRWVKNLFNGFLSLRLVRP